MPTFPPRVTAFTDESRVTASTDQSRASSTTDQNVGGRSGDPDTRSPGRLMWWMLNQQRRAFAAMVGLGLAWFLPGALGPWLVGRAVDEGIVAGDPSATAFWAGMLAVAVVFGAASGILLHTSEVVSWLTSLYGTVLLVNRKSVQLGHVLPRRTPTGEVLSVSASDSDTFGAGLVMLGHALAAVAAFVVVAGLVLSTSVPLGLVVLVSAPVIVAAAAPMLRPLHRTRAVERNRLSELTSMATDIVAGLRILRGVGGEATFGTNYADKSAQTRRAGVRAGGWQSGVDALGVLLSGLFLVTLTWLGARELTAGRLTVGELISFFGFAVFVTHPIQVCFYAVQAWVQALVAARKTIAVYGQQPPWQVSRTPVPLPASGRLDDPTSGFSPAEGQLTVVVSGTPDDSAALADRLGRYLPDVGAAPSLEVEESLRGRARRRAQAEAVEKVRERGRADAERAAARWGVTLGGVDLADLDLAELRAHVLVSDTGSSVFAGTLQQAVDPHGRASREQAEAALATAAAEDVYLALPGGWQGLLEERGRGLSGGQRQRLVLARALLVEAPVLVLVEPTSAVDAHTEARIAERVAAARRGRTTVVMTVSPLWLHHADRVVLLQDARVAAEGSHAELLASHAGYRRVVVRGMEAVDA